MREQGENDGSNDADLVGFAHKTARPTDGGQLVHRDRVSQTLSGNRPLTTVIAPAGYGKTTAVVHWTTESPGPVAWVNVDEADRDASRFWSQVGTAIRRADPSAVPLSTMEWLARPSGIAPSVRLGSLLDHFNGNPHVGDPGTDPLRLIIDDYHLCMCPEVHEALTYLVRHQPRSLDLIVVSRSEPGLPTGRLIAQDRAIAVGPGDLKLTPHETKLVLERAGAVVDYDTVDRIHRATEGWPVMVALAAAALKVGGLNDVIDRDTGFMGRHQLVADYLVHEIHRHLDADDQNFVEETSMLKRLTGPLCDAVTGSHGGAARLERLNREGFPLMTFDPDGNWYRLSDLVIAALQRRLVARTSAPQRRALHKRAAAWFDESEMQDDAFHHAIEAAEYDVAAERFVRSGLDAVRRGELQGALHLLERFPSRAVIDDARLSLARAWIGVMTGQIDGVRGWLDDSLRAGGEHQRWLPDASGVAAAAALVESEYFRLLGQLGKATQAAASALEIEAEPDSRGRASALTARGICAFWNGDLARAEVLLEQAAGTGERLGNPIVQLSACGYLGLVAAERNDVQAALGHVEAGQSAARNHELTSHPATVATFAAAAAVEINSGGGLGNTAALLARALTAASVQGEPAMMAYLYDLKQRFEESEQRSAEADRARDIARSFVSRYPDIGFVRDRVGSTHPPDVPGPEPLTPLTPRETTVLKLLASSLTLADIGRELYVSRNTVKSQSQSIYRKLGVSRRVDAVRAGALAGLI